MSTVRPGALPGVLTVIVAASLFGTLGTLSRETYAQGLTPFAFVAWRAVVGGAALLGAIVLLQRRGSGRPFVPWSAMSAATRRSLLVAIVAGSALNLAMFFAFQRTTIALALLGFYTYPAIVAGLSVALGRERLDPARLLALLLALVGMVFVVLGATTGSLEIDALGLAAALGAAACQSAFVLVSRDYASIPTQQAMAAILGGAGVLGIVATGLLEGPAQLFTPFGQPALLAMLLGIGVFTAAVPSSLFLAGIRRLGGIRTGILMLAEPVVGVALAAIFLAEALAPLQVIGGATILVAAILVQRDPTPQVLPIVTPVPGGP